MDPKSLDKAKEQEFYSDEEINELAEWAEGLTIKQLFFLKDSYEALQEIRVHEANNGSNYLQ